MIRVLLVDDHANVLQGLKMRLELEHDLAIAGTALSASEALTQAEELHPDVIVMDVEMPEMDGIAATKLLRAQNQAVKIVMLSIHSDTQLQDQAKEAGAAYFVSKHSSVETLLEAIRQAAEQQDR